MATSKNSDREYSDQEVLIEAFYQNVKNRIMMTEPPEGMNPLVKENLLETLVNLKKKCRDDEFKTWDDERTHLPPQITNLRANEESRKVKLGEKTLRELEEWDNSRSTKIKKRRSHWEAMC